jgi:hypothetical protein
MKLRNLCGLTFVTGVPVLIVGIAMVATMINGYGSDEK